MLFIWLPNVIFSYCDLDTLPYTLLVLTFTLYNLFQVYRFSSSVQMSPFSNFVVQHFSMWSQYFSYFLFRLNSYTPSFFVSQVLSIKMVYLYTFSLFCWSHLFLSSMQIIHQDGKMNVFSLVLNFKAFLFPNSADLRGSYFVPKVVWVTFLNYVEFFFKYSDISLFLFLLIFRSLPESVFAF